MENSGLTSTVAKVSAISTGLWGLTFNEWIAVAGISIALISLLVDIHFKHKRLKIMERKGEEKERRHSRPIDSK